MKQLFSIAVCAACFSISPPRVLAQNATVPNASFENVNPLSGWSFRTGEGGTGQVEAEMNIAAGGQSAAEMTMSNARGHIVFESDFISAQAGKNYEVTAKVRNTQRARSTAYLMISQYSADDAAMRFPNYFSTAQPIFADEDFVTLRVWFPVREGSTRIRIHFVMADAPGTLIWDDVTLREAATATIGENHTPFSPATPETLPPIDDALLKKLRQQPETIGETRVLNGRTRLFMNGKMTAPNFMVPPFVEFFRDTHIADFKKAGVETFLVPLVLGRDVYSERGVWVGKNQFDFKEVEERLLRVLRVAPDANIIFYLITDPYRTWPDEHPRAILKDQNGLPSVIMMHVLDWGRAPDPTPSGYRQRYGFSYVSADLRAETADALRRLVAHLKTIDAGKAVVGFHIAGGSDAQMFQWQGFKPDETSYTPQNYHLADYSDDARDEFRRWLRRKYLSVNTLRRAWNNPTVTFERALIPSGERRLAPGFFFDPQTDGDIFDYNQFQSEGTAETLASYARVLKEATGGKKLVSAYWEDIVSSGQTHNATAAMIASPDFNFFAGPTTYGARMPGFPGGVHTSFSSMALHGKFWVSEQDWRSWHTESNGAAHDDSVGRANNAAQHNAMVRRESGMMLAFGQGTWWYDMGGSKGGGWFADEGIMKGVKEARSAFDRDLSTQGTLRADLAVIVSERSMDAIKTFAAPNAMQPYRYGLQQQIRALNTAGVPYHLYVQSDLPKLKQNYKMFLFLNAHRFDAAEWNALQRLKSSNRVLVFVHAPGVMSPQVVGAKNADDAIEKVTGIRVKKISDAGDFAVLPMPENRRRSPLAIDDMPGILPPQAAPESGPTWRVEDKDNATTPLGLYENGEIGAAMKPMKNWTSVFLGGIVPSDAFIHALAKYAKAWCVSEVGDAVYANQNFLTAHAIWDGEKTFTLAQPSKIVDMTTNEIISPRASSFNLKMKRGETRWFALTPINKK